MKPALFRGRGGGEWQGVLGAASMAICEDTRNNMRLLFCLDFRELSSPCVILKKITVTVVLMLTVSSEFI